MKLKSYFLKKNNFYVLNPFKVSANVIMVDWEKGAWDERLLHGSTYRGASTNAKKVGQEIAKFIELNRIKPSDVTCIGHSLGKLESILELSFN